MRRVAAEETASTEGVLPELLTPDEVATWLKTSIGAVYAKAERGKLPGATRLGRRLYFIRSELVAYVHQSRVPHLGGPSDSTQD